MKVSNFFSWIIWSEATTKNQLFESKVEELDIMNRLREKEVKNALNSASVDLLTSHSAILTEHPSGIELQADQVNKTHLDLSMAPNSGRKCCSQ